MSFGVLGRANQRIIKAPVNPMDRCTVVSIYPQAVCEIKETLQPREFKLLPGSFKSPSVLVVGTGNWYREVDEDQPLLEIPNMSIQVADSIVKDYCNGLLGCDMSGRMPGLFYVMGCKTVPGDAKQTPSTALTLEWIRKEHSELLNAAKIKQDNWFRELVKLADIQWARTQGNPLSVDDTMRMAARELGLEDKLWLKDTQAVELVKCNACGSLRNPLYPVCPNCKAINDAKAAEGIKFAS